MIENLEDLQSLYSGKITVDEFASRLFDSRIPVDVELKKLFLDAISTQNALEVEICTVLLNSSFFTLNFFVGELCLIVRQGWHFKHEDVAMLLKTTRDPNIVDPLFETATETFEYLSYDDTFQLARKCIKAIAAIGNEHALARLQSLANNKNQTIAEYAQRELDREKKY